MKNIFITGQKGIGKSTIISKVLASLDLPIGGYMTEREIVNNIKSFSIRSLGSGEVYPFARVDLKTLDKDINKDNFKDAIPKFLTRDMENSSLIILDELGFMENDIDEFTSKIYDILDSSLLVLGVLKDYDCEFLNIIKNRKDCLIIKVTEDNRDKLEEEILERIKINI